MIYLADIVARLLGIKREAAGIDRPGYYSFSDRVSPSGKIP